ncbi:YidH family protein [Sphingomonas sp. LaA6.9]|uniref:YidH family protein n=1 Tax=Sphingomonas sp. LaA6.9 TaxID=2919914 RepID=UPI001F4FFA67|nr:DUF202 domain-containing protein [Sphingomonas sp. LaA6.9]MCJ8158084.1 DUF202 domain-containing protein [Sphingomonas sp. LaA6.9]
MTDREPGIPPPKRPERPERFAAKPLPRIPDVSGQSEGAASVEYSRYRTGLSHHRTEISEHRTDLSEYRTDLSGFRTDLSSERTEMSMNRTGMSIQRTRMSADRTLMSVIRTSLSMIAFGFTLYQVFQKLHEADVIVAGAAPRNFGLSLILLGIVILVGGIWRHVQFAREMRQHRELMIGQGLITGKRSYPVSVTLIVAIGLMLVGIAAILSIAFGFNMFG